MSPPPRPALRYHGGKWRLAPWILSHFPPHRYYTEVYGGAASVLLRKPRVRRELYNDLDSEIVNVFRVLREPDLAGELERLLRLTPFAREEFELSYEEAPDAPVEQARRTIVRCFFGHGSSAQNPEHRTGFRTRDYASHTSGGADWTSYADALPFFTRRLYGVVIECREALGLLEVHDTPETLHYVDPPYVHGTRASLSHPYRHEMDEGDHRSLADVLHGLDGAVVLSGYHGPLYDGLYRDWRTVERVAVTDGADRASEVLWLNERASRGSQIPLL